MCACCSIVYKTLQECQGVLCYSLEQGLEATSRLQHLISFTHVCAYTHVVGMPLQTMASTYAASTVPLLDNYLNDDYSYINYI